MKEKNKLVCENLDEFIGSNLNEGIFDRVKSKFDSVISSISKVGKFYVAKFKDFVLNVGLPINIGLLIKAKKLGKYDYYIPSNEDLVLEPSLSSLNNEGMLALHKTRIQAEQAELHKKFKTPAALFKARKASAVKESALIKTKKYKRILEHVDDMKAPKGYGIPDVNTDSLMRFVRTAMLFPTKKSPLMIWGAPGIGKTSIISKVIDSKKQEGSLIFLDIQYTTPESWFMPYLQDAPEEPGGKKYVDMPRNILPLYLPTGDPEKDRAANEKANGKNNAGGIIFLDEIMRGTPQVLGTCLSLMAGRRIEQYQLGDKWTVICASNRKKDMSAAELLNYDRILDNRLTHVNYVPVYKDWRQWAESSGVNSAILSFLDHKYESLWYDPGFTDSDPDNVRKAWASPRSWTDLSESLSMAKAEAEFSGTEFTRLYEAEVMCAGVGAPVAEQLFAFIHITDKYKLESIEKIWTDPTRGPRLEKQGESGDGIVLTEVTAITSIAIDKRKHVERLDPKEFANFCKWVVSLDHAGAASYAVKMLVEIAARYIHEELGDHKKDEKGKEIGTYKEGGDILRKTYGILWGASKATV